MEIKGIQKVTLLDYPGKVACTVFTGGCNFRCPFCQNSDLVISPALTPTIAGEEIFGFLRKRRGLLDAICISGGEPLLQSATPELCRRLLAHGFEVLMETNGSVDISPLPAGVKRIVDWKTPFSGESARMLDSNFRSLRPGDEVKFVIANRADYDAALDVVRRFDVAAHATVLFAPVFGEIEPRALVEWMLADRAPARLNLQFHKIVWSPDAEGV